ncbi:hypothetical protein [Oceaniglobus indicus]|uniref:hypothetical protein n=1 Tax=Oceaniglobus indicus TaxID=2047749 RepID=UPI0011AB6D55|nr:hypothetical protein [Oceaniglobus indicus]
MLNRLSLALCLIAAPALALEPIGTVTARLQEADLSWNVLRTDDGAAMVQVNAIGPLTMVNLHATGDGNVSFGLVFQGQPSTDVPLTGITVEMWPEGGDGPLWTSNGAPSPPIMRFERLDLDGAGRMEASFSAILCRGDATETCETVEGRFDTELSEP